MNRTLIQSKRKIIKVYTNKEYVEAIRKSKKGDTIFFNEVK